MTQDPRPTDPKAQQRGVGVILTPAQSAEVDAAIENKLNDFATQGKFAKATMNTWSIWSIVVVFIVGGLMTLLLLNETGVIDLSSQATPEGEEVPDQPAALTDLLGSFLPIFTIAIAFFVGATGLSRLSLYDEQFSQNR